MKLEIQIQCDDYGDLMSHLSVIRMQIRNAFKVKGDPENVEIEDSNCYGSHTIKINPKE
jgi:hypothetical protein